MTKATTLLTVEISTKTWLGIHFKKGPELLVKINCCLQVRTGLFGKHLYAMEKLFYDAGVDLQFYAHEHSYERLLPVYNLTVNPMKDFSNIHVKRSNKILGIYYYSYLYRLGLQWT